MKKKEGQNQKENMYHRSLSFYNNPDLKETTGKAKFGFYNNPDVELTPETDKITDEDLKYCPNCGYGLHVQTDQEAPQKIVFCPNCGEKLQ